MSENPKQAGGTIKIKSWSSKRCLVASLSDSLQMLILCTMEPKKDLKPVIVLDRKGIDELRNLLNLN